MSRSNTILHHHLLDSTARTYVIAEAGINHNKNLFIALKLADAAKASGADCVKYQLEFPSDYTLTYEETKRVYRHCEAIGLPFSCTAFDLPSLRFILDNCQVPFVKIASANWGGEAIVTFALLSRLPILVSTRTDDDIAERVNLLYSERVTLLHCVGEYPTPVDRANLSRITQLSNEFDNPIGLSDHSANPVIPVAAVALGASVIECHLTLDQNQPGPDHKASLEPDQFAWMVKAIRDVELAL